MLNKIKTTKSKYKNIQCIKYISISSFCLVIFLCGCGDLLQKQTEIINGIDKDTVWDKAHSPYYLRGDILIPVNTTLTIEPGTIVTFSGNNKLKVEGILKAKGTTPDPIWFRQAGKYFISGYYGIVFAGKQPKSNSILANCIITQARFAVYCDGDSPQITYCTITGNNEGVHLWNSNASVAHNNISNNNEDGVYIGSMNPTFINNLITGNWRGIVCDYAPNPYIQQNDIFGNTEYDFYLSRTEHDIYAQNNWWGIIDEQAIRQKIYDKQKDGALGNVIISPIQQQHI
jgi:parallel beta-helix repeat protein